MPSAPLLEFDALVVPIAGDKPAGDPVGFDVREKLDDMRKEDDPDNYAPDDPMRPERFRKADWPGIIRISKETLSGKSKDLLVAARLTEALVKQSGFTGLRDGLHLLRLLVEQCWDRLNPLVEEPDDVDLRASPFNWLDDPDRGSRFPSTLRTTTMLAGDEGAKFAWVDWKSSQEGKGKVTQDQFDKAIRVTPLERCQAALEDLTESRTELLQLTQALTEKMAQAAPALMGLRQAVEDCRLLAQQIVQIKAPALSEGDVGAAAGEPGAARPARAAGSREEAYRQLAQAAAVLRQLEPHSPIPYLIQRAVALGALPFPQMIRALIREPNVLSELSRELGIVEEEAKPST